MYPGASFSRLAASLELYFFLICLKLYDFHAFSFSNSMISVFSFLLECYLGNQTTILRSSQTLESNSKFSNLKVVIFSFIGLWFLLSNSFWLLWNLYILHIPSERFFSVRGRYDDDRQIAYDILKQFPSPLPGYKSSQRLTCLIKTALEWLKRLCFAKNEFCQLSCNIFYFFVFSPRMHECDSACLTLNIIVEKFMKEAQWSIRIQNNDVICIEHNTEYNCTIYKEQF